MKKKIKSGKKEKIIYHEPPMRYNVALHKFEVNLPIINEDSNKKIYYNQLNILFLIIFFIFIVIVFH